LATPNDSSIGEITGLPLLLLSLGDVPDQVGSNGFRVRTKLVDKFRIPKVVQIARPESAADTRLSLPPRSLSSEACSG
jgi:hypothetical protein